MLSSFQLKNGAQVIDKAPGANLDYTIDWTDWLEVGDTLATSIWTVEAGVTLGTVTFNTTTATAFISGGTLGENVRATNTITTANGLTDSRSFKLAIRAR